MNYNDDTNDDMSHIVYINSPEEIAIEKLEKTQNIVVVPEDLDP